MRSQAEVSQAGYGIQAEVHERSGESVCLCGWTALAASS